MSTSRCFVFVLAIAGMCCLKLPDDFTRCGIMDPDINDCIKRSQKDAVLKMRHGRKSIGIPDLDPLMVNSIVIGEGTGPVNVKQTYSNLKMYGLVDYETTFVDAQIVNDKVVIETLNPEVQIIGDYEMNGRVLLLPIQGNGKCNLTLVGLKTTNSLFADRIEKNGKTYWSIKEYKVKIEPERLYMHFENLFNGDERLGVTMNNFLNENWKEIFAELKPSFEESFGLIFKELSNRVFQKIPMMDIFL